MVSRNGTDTQGTSPQRGQGRPPAEIVEVLRQVPLFADLTPRDLDQIRRYAVQRTYAPGRRIIVQGEPGDALEIILEGEVRVSLTQGVQEEVVLATLGAGEPIGEMALLDQGERSATITALSPTETLVLSRHDFMALVRDNSDMAIALLQVMAKRLRATDQLVERAGQHTVDSRKELVQVPLFAGLTERQHKQIQQCAARRTYRRGQQIMAQGEPGDTLAIISAGVVGVSVTSTSGQQVVVANLGAGEPVGELALLDGSKRSATVTVITETAEALVLSRAAFFSLIREHWDIALALLRVLAHRLRATDHLLQQAQAGLERARVL